MSEMSPYQMDRRLTELAGKLLTDTMTKAEESERYFLQIDRRNSVCDFPSDAEFQRQLNKSRR
jgi:hypothetical protein